MLIRLEYWGFLGVDQRANRGNPDALLNFDGASGLPNVPSHYRIRERD
jgi:hypothetical protein